MRWQSLDEIERHEELRRRLPASSPREAALFTELPKHGYTIRMIGDHGETIAEASPTGRVIEKHELYRGNVCILCSKTVSSHHSGRRSHARKHLRSGEIVEETAHYPIRDVFRITPSPSTEEVSR